MQKIQAVFGEKGSAAELYVETKHFVSTAKITSFICSTNAPGFRVWFRQHQSHEVSSVWRRSLCPVRACGPPEELSDAGRFISSWRETPCGEDSRCRAGRCRHTPDKATIHSAFSHSRWRRTNWTNSKKEDLKKKKINKIWASKIRKTCEDMTALWKSSQDDCREQPWWSRY